MQLQVDLDIDTFKSYMTVIIITLEQQFKLCTKSNRECKEI